MFELIIASISPLPRWFSVQSQNTSLQLIITQTGKITLAYCFSPVSSVDVKVFTIKRLR